MGINALGLDVGAAERRRRGGGKRQRRQRITSPLTQRARKQEIPSDHVYIIQLTSIATVVARQLLHGVFGVFLLYHSEL